MKKIFAVIGNPIAQSKSPVIHQAFAAQFDEEISYDKKLVEIGDFHTVADQFFNNDGLGLNITAPFKHDAYTFATTLTQRAKLAEAVNTLVRQDDGSILGDNTDGVGLLNDIQDRLKWSVKNKRLLILGAGGAVRGVLFPFLSASPSEVVVANRTGSRAVELAEKFQTFGNIKGIGLSDLQKQKRFDLIINGSSAGLNGAKVEALPSSCYDEQTYFYDMSYSNNLTPFLSWANSLSFMSSKVSGFDCLSDGLGMLIGQAAESFHLWTGHRPELEQVMDVIRRS